MVYNLSLSAKYLLMPHSSNLVEKNNGTKELYGLNDFLINDKIVKIAFEYLYEMFQFS